MQVDIINQLGEQIGTKLAKAEEEGAKGDVDASLKFMEEVEDLKKRKTQEEVTIDNIYMSERCCIFPKTLKPVH